MKIVIYMSGLCVDFYDYIIAVACEEGVDCRTNSATVIVVKGQVPDVKFSAVPIELWNSSILEEVMRGVVEKWSGGGFREFYRCELRTPSSNCEHESLVISLLEDVMKVVD